MYYLAYDLWYVISKFELKHSSDVSYKRTYTERSTALDSMSIFEDMENRLSSLERRLRAVEQPGKNFVICDGYKKAHPYSHSLADRPERGGLGDLCRGTVQMRTWNQIGVLLEIRSVGSAFCTASSRRCAETVSDLKATISLREKYYSSKSHFRNILSF